jgi:hypothetical protein
VWIPGEKTSLFLFPIRTGDLTALRHLHLTWQGLDGGVTKAWGRFPRSGDIPWFSVAPLAEADPLRRPITGPALPPSPNFDAMQSREPEVS